MTSFKISKQFGNINEKKWFYFCFSLTNISIYWYIDSPKWIKKQNKKKTKKKTINPKNEGDKYFQYAATVALNSEEINCNSERVSNIEPFINKYDWEGINYPSKKDDWKTFEKINLTIALNILYIKEKEIVLVFISKHNSNS